MTIAIHVIYDPNGLITLPPAVVFEAKGISAATVNLPAVPAVGDIEALTQKLTALLLAQIAAKEPSGG